MELYGPFEAGRLIDSGGGSSVFEARKEGDPKGRYVVKVFSPEHLVAEEEGDDTRIQLDPLFKDIGASFTDRVNLQKAAAAASPNFVPILAAGHDQRGGWYATHFYARSVKGMLERFVVLDAADLFHLLQSLTQAALHLKKTAKRPHGNLKPGNIFIDGDSRVKSSRVLVDDPLAGDFTDSAAFEIADLHSIGQVLYQLVLRRKMDFEAGWVILPVEASKEWAEIFGKKAGAWLALCNKLLDPNLRPEDYTLEKLQAELLGLKPRIPAAMIAIPAGAVAVALIATAAFLFFHKSKYGKILITTDPPGAEITIIPEDVALQHYTNRTRLDGKPIAFKLEGGNYTIKAAYTNLDSLRPAIGIVAGKTFTTNLSFSYGGMVVLSDPPGATFRLEEQGRDFSTPYTNRYVKPGQRSVQLSRQRFETATITNVVPADHKEALFSVKLQEPPPGDVLVSFTSDPAGAEIFVDDVVLTGVTPLQKSVKEGFHKISAHVRWLLPQERNFVFAGAANAQDFKFVYGSLVLESQPAECRVFVGGQFVGTTPTNIAWPIGAVSISFTNVGFESTNFTVNLGDKGSVALNPALRALGVVLEIASDPPRAEVRTAANKTLGSTGPDGSGEIALQPGSYDLKAYFGDLQPVTVHAEVKLSQTKKVDRFSFDYGNVTFADIQPADARASAVVSRADQTQVELGKMLYQRPKEGYAYGIKADGYEPFTTNVVVGKGEKLSIENIILNRLRVPMRFVTDPPGIEVVYNGKLTNTSGEAALPWGSAELIGRHPRLGSITNNLEVKLAGPNVDPEFKFEYGSLVATNLGADVSVQERGVTVPFAPRGNDKVAFEKPGVHIYDLFWRGQKLDTVTNEIVRGIDSIIHSELLGTEWVNSLPMRLVKIPELFGAGKDGWVGKFEVTQEQFQKIMGADANRSAFKGQDLPVLNVSWLEATNFCNKLTQLDNKKPFAYAGHYSLPTVEQWRKFSFGAEVKDAVCGRTNPAPAGAKGSANVFRVCDVLGNAREWLDAGDAKNKLHIGGGFRTPAKGFRGVAAFLEPESYQFDQVADDLGFRVIYVPN